MKIKKLNELKLTIDEKEKKVFELVELGILITIDKNEDVIKFQHKNMINVKFGIFDGECMIVYGIENFGFFDMLKAMSTCVKLSIENHKELSNLLKTNKKEYEKATNDLCEEVINEIRYVKTINKFLKELTINIELVDKLNNVYELKN